MQNTTNFSTLFTDMVTQQREKRIEQKKKTWIPEFSRCKASMKYRNGTSSTPYHSFDIKYVRGINETNEQRGFYWLLERVIYPALEQEKYFTASVFCKLGTDLRTYIDGRQAMDYNFMLFNHTFHQQPWFSPWIKWTPDNKLDIEFIRKCMAAGKEDGIYKPRK